MEGLSPFSFGFLLMLAYVFVIGFVLYVFWSILATLRSMDRTMTELARRLRDQP